MELNTNNEDTIANSLLHNFELHYSLCIIRYFKINWKYSAKKCTNVPDKLPGQARAQ